MPPYLKVYITASIARPSLSCFTYLAMFRSAPSIIILSGHVDKVRHNCRIDCNHGAPPIYLEQRTCSAMTCLRMCRYNAYIASS